MRQQNVTHARVVADRPPRPPEDPVNTTPEHITTLARADQPWAPRPHAPFTLAPGDGAQPGVVVPPEQLAALIAAAQLAQQPAVPQQPAAAPVETRISGRAKGAALVAAAGGVGVGAAGAGIGYGAALIADHSEGLMTAAMALGIAGGSIAAVVLFLRFMFSGASRTAGTSAGPTYHQTVNNSWLSKGSIHNH
ncbi:hypothetical protein ACH4NT_36645 [Streptomyces lydicus]|uniref:hypothetical protein n=1 Tax=Streptomyces lydicus TaxID=47763 RepID=UPI0037B1BB0E